MQHLRKKGFGGDLMERLINDEVNELILNLTKRCEVWDLTYYYFFSQTNVQ